MTVNNFFSMHPPVRANRSQTISPVTSPGASCSQVLANDHRAAAAVHVVHPVVPLSASPAARAHTHTYTHKQKNPWLIFPVSQASF